MLERGQPASYSGPGQEGMRSSVALSRRPIAVAGGSLSRLGWTGRDYSHEAEDAQV